MPLAHVAQTGGDKLLRGDGQMGVEQYIEEVERLAEVIYLRGGAEINKAVDSGRLGWQVMMPAITFPVPHHHRPEFASQQLEELGAGLIDCLLAGLVLASGNRAPSRLKAGGGGMIDDAI